jgi:sugar lactone lactonase YvrE
VGPEGFLWSVQWYGSLVVRCDPGGRVERRIETPTEQTSSCAFGGAQLELGELYITSAARSGAHVKDAARVQPGNWSFRWRVIHDSAWCRGTAMPMADILLY